MDELIMKIMNEIDDDTTIKSELSRKKIQDACEIGKLKVGMLDRNFKIKYLTERIKLLQKQNEAQQLQIINFEKSLGNLEQSSFKLKPNDILYFMHIPKTAGTSLITILENYFEPNSILKAHDWEELLPKMPMDLSKIRFVRGHFGYSMLRTLPKKPICITMLRNPTDVVVSSIQMIRRQPRDAKRYSISDNQNISDIIIKSKLDLMKNPQTHWFLMDQDILARTGLMNKDELKNYRPEEDNEILTIHPEKNFIHIAKRRLYEFAFVGLVEKMEESLFLLHYTFGWKPIKDFIKKNEAPIVDQQETVSDEALLKIRSWTMLDLLLYQYGKQLFESRYLEMIENLKKKYYTSEYDEMRENEMVFHMLNKHYEENKKSN